MGVGVGVGVGLVDGVGLGEAWSLVWDETPPQPATASVKTAVRARTVKVQREEDLRGPMGHRVFSGAKSIDAGQRLWVCKLVNWVDLVIQLRGRFDVTSWDYSWCGPSFASDRICHSALPQSTISLRPHLGH